MALLFAFPGVLALGALVLAIFLLRGPGKGEPRTLAATIVAVILLIFFFGVAACYGMVVFS